MDRVVRFKVAVTVEIPINAQAGDSPQEVLYAAEDACKDKLVLESLLYAVDNPVTSVELLEAPQMVEV